MNAFIRHAISPTIALLLIVATISTARGAAQQSAPSQRDIDALVRDVLLDVWTMPDFARRASINDLAAKQQTVRADLLPLNVRLTAAALPNIPEVEFTLMSYQDAAATAERTGRRVPFIEIRLLTFTSAEATVRLGSDFAAPPDPGIIKLCCCSRIAYYTRHQDRWTFRGWGARQCS
jgi:hypothetical protein